MATRNKQTKRSAARTTPRKRAASSRPKSISERIYETDSTYFLKLVVIAICGTLWLKFREPLEWMGIDFNALPLGLLLGVVFVKLFEKHQSDRKIWYAVLLVVGIISYFVPAGIVI